MPVPQGRRRIKRELLRETAYAALSEAIVDGTLAPGEHLNDAELCDWLGLSRTPVREALVRLDDEGLVQTAPQRYTRVCALGQEDARQAFPVLACLHALATELAVPRLAMADHERLRAANDAYVKAIVARDARAACTADHDFHAVFVAVAGNPDIERSLRHLAPRLHRMEQRRGVLPGRRAEAQHDAIVSRAAIGDAAGAAAAVRANWMTLGALVEHALAPAPE